MLKERKRRTPKKRDMKAASVWECVGNVVQRQVDV